ncbi:MAG: DUF1285 domain-containing protein [Myxococcaceae bacterium]|nr:DUF1285 domain-containing protein [Myxococcaceae bacterium]
MQPKRWHTREDSGLRLDRELRWWHDGELIDHPNIIEAFNRGVRVGDDGRVTLHFGGDWCFIEVEDAPFRVVAVDVSEGDRLSVRLSDRTAEWLDVNSLGLDDDGVLSVRVKAGRAKARFGRDAQFQVAQHLELDGDTVQLRVGARLEPTPLPARAFG